MLSVTSSAEYSSSSFSRKTGAKRCSSWSYVSSWRESALLSAFPFPLFPQNDRKLTKKPFGSKVSPSPDSSSSFSSR